MLTTRRSVLAAQRYSVTPVTVGQQAWPDGGIHVARQHNLPAGRADPVEIVMASPHIDMLRPSWRCIHSRAKAVTESCRAILQSQ